MSKPQPQQNAASFEVENPAAAFHKLEESARKIMAIPKRQIDAKMAQGKAGKPKPKRA